MTIRRFRQPSLSTNRAIKTVIPMLQLHPTKAQAATRASASLQLNMGTETLEKLARHVEACVLIYFWPDHRGGEVPSPTSPARIFNLFGKRASFDRTFSRQLSVLPRVDRENTVRAYTCW